MTEACQMSASWTYLWFAYGVDKTEKQTSNPEIMYHYMQLYVFCIES